MTVALAGCAVLLALAWHRTHPVPSFATPYPLYGPRSNTMPTTKNVTTTDLGYRPDGDAKVGELDGPANTVLDAAPEDLDTIDVVVNVGLARTPNGHHPILVRGPSTLTAAQAHQLSIDLGTASRFVADIRRDAGYES